MTRNKNDRIIISVAFISLSRIKNYDCGWFAVGLRVCQSVCLRYRDATTRAGELSVVNWNWSGARLLSEVTRVTSASVVVSVECQVIINWLRCWTWTRRSGINFVRISYLNVTFRNQNLPMSSCLFKSYFCN